MSHEPVRVRALTLAREDIRALTRSPFALGAVTVILAALAPFAAVVMHGPNAMSDYLLFLWMVAELVVAVVLAARIAAVRRSRFVDSLYTTPLDARSWLVAQMLVGAFLATLILLGQVPYVLVHLALVGVPPAFAPILLAAVGVAVFAVAFGTFCGVIVGDAGPGPAAGLAGGLGFLFFFMLILHAVFGSAPPSATQEFFLRLTALSPLKLVVDATGIDIFDIAPEDAWRAPVGLAGLVLGLGGAAWVAYTRCQSPIGWEPGRGRVAVVALVLVALVLPVATASVNYHEVEDSDHYVLKHGEYTRVVFAPSGTPINDDAFALHKYYEWDELTYGEDNTLDALVMLLVPEGERVNAVRIEVRGSPNIEVVAGGHASIPSGAPDGRARQGQSWDEDAEATGPLRPVYRVPVVLRPVEALALLSSPGIMEVDTTFEMNGRTHTSQSRLTLESDVPGAAAALFIAGTPLPLAAFATLITRRIRTR